MLIGSIAQHTFCTVRMRFHTNASRTGFRNPLTSMSQAQPPIPSQGPLDAAVVALDARDVLSDAFVEERLPRHELEAETVLDHRKATTPEVDDSSETAADVVARSRREVGQTTLSRHLLPYPFDIESLKSRYGADRDMDVAVFRGREPIDN